MNKRFFAALIASVATLWVAGGACAQSYYTEKGKVQFESEATMESFTGTSESLVGKVNLADKSLDFYLDLATLTTGVGLRDEHMRENHLETEKFPFAEFFGTLEDDFDPQGTEQQEVTAKGVFKIHGVIQKQKKELLLFLGDLVGDNIAHVSKAEIEKISGGLYLLFESAITESHLHQNDWPIYLAKSIAPSLFSEAKLKQ